MRLHFSLTQNERPVPFDYQHYLAGASHKWLGANGLHDRLSLYSLSWLYEGHARGREIEFPTALAAGEVDASKTHPDRH